MNMRKLKLLATLGILATSLVVTAPAHAQDVHVRLNTGGSHIYFGNEPNVVLVPGTRVYYSPYGDDDVYRYRNTWYVNRGGTWYRANSYNGTYYYVRPNRVPYQIMNVPSDWRAQYRRDHGRDNDQDNNWNDHQWRHHRRD
jgi:hypothetical protein